MTDWAVIVIALIVATVVLVAAWKGRRLRAEIGTIHFELTANGGDSGSLRDLVLVAVGHAREAHKRTDELMRQLAIIESRIQVLERRVPPAA